MKPGPDKACSAALSAITKHGCLHPHHCESWLCHPVTGIQCRVRVWPTDVTHCQLQHIFTVQLKVYKRALIWIAHWHNFVLPCITQAVFQQFKRELSSEESPQSLLIAKLFQLSKLHIFLTENTCSITLIFLDILQFHVIEAYLILKQCVYIATTFPNIGEENNNQLNPQKILINLSCGFGGVLVGWLAFCRTLLSKLTSIYFYYITKMFLKTIFSSINNPVYTYSFDQTFGAKKTLVPALAKASEILFNHKEIK